MNAVNIDTMETDRQAFADLAKEIGIRRLMERREENDRYPFGELFTDAIQDAGAVGFFGINLPEDQGGIGMNSGMVACILEKICEYDASLSGVIFANAAALEVLSAASARIEKQEIYQSIDSSGVVPLAFPAYSSPGEMEMPAVDEKCTSITGTVEYLVLGDIADYAVIPARHTGPETCSWFLVDMRENGIEKSGPVVSLGLHACPAVDVTFRNVPARLIGAPGEGHRYFSRMRDRMSVCTAAMSLGLMRGSFQDSLRYTADRCQGGRQIIDWSQVRMMLADMAIEMKVAESCVAMACREMDAGVCGWEKTAQAAAIHAGVLATRSCTDGVQLFGGNGYMKDYPQEKRMRDARQVQSLLGMVPLRKMEYIARIIAENE